MKKASLLSMVMLIVAGLAQMAEADDWYGIMAAGGCAKLSQISSGTWKTPADLIKAYQTLETPYKVNDGEVEKGKVVQVTIINLSDYSSLTFYYGLERCNKALKARKTKQAKELEKYK